MVQRYGEESRARMQPPEAVSAIIRNIQRASRSASRMALVGAVTLASTTGCGLFSDADEKRYFGETRPSGELEYQYLALASEMHSVKPCYLIHADSLSKAAFNSPGNQASLVRSECFSAVASASGDAQPCDKVRSVSTLFLSGANLDSDACHRAARARGSIAYGLDVPRVVALSGFEEGEVDEYLAAEGRFSSPRIAGRYRQQRPSLYWGEVRRHLLHSEEFFDRIDDLEGHAASADRAAMSALPWQPRPQRPWQLPERRSPLSQQDADPRDDADFEVRRDARPHESVPDAQPSAGQ